MYFKFRFSILDLVCDVFQISVDLFCILDVGFAKTINLMIRLGENMDNEI